MLKINLIAFGMLLFCNSVFASAPTQLSDPIYTTHYCSCIYPWMKSCNSHIKGPSYTPQVYKQRFHKIGLAASVECIPTCTREAVWKAAVQAQQCQRFQDTVTAIGCHNSLSKKPRPKEFWNPGILTFKFMTGLDPAAVRKNPSLLQSEEDLRNARLKVWSDLFACRA